MKSRTSARRGLRASLLSLAMMPLIAAPVLAQVFNPKTFELDNGRQVVVVETIVRRS